MLVILNFKLFLFYKKKASFCLPISLCLSNLRWLQATKSIISGTNTQALTAKADLLKEEVDEAMNKVELCKVTSIHIFIIIYIFTFYVELYCFTMVLFIKYKRNVSESVGRSEVIYGFVCKRNWVLYIFFSVLNWEKNDHSNSCTFQDPWAL